MTIAERLIQKGFDEGFDEGFKEGFKKGALEVAREAACRLRDMGWTPERIQEAAGLSGEELKNCFLMSSSPGILPCCESRSHILCRFPQFIFQTPDDICLAHPLHVRQQVTD